MKNENRGMNSFHNLYPKFLFNYLRVNDLQVSKAAETEILCLVKLFDGFSTATFFLRFNQFSSAAGVLDQLLYYRFNERIRS